MAKKVSKSVKKSAAPHKKKSTPAKKLTVKKLAAKVKVQPKSASKKAPIKKVAAKKVVKAIKVAKKVVVQKAIPQKVKIEPALAVVAEEPKVVAIAPVLETPPAQLPPRAPTRKLIGANNTVTIVPPKNVVIVDVPVVLEPTKEIPLPQLASIMVSEPPKVAAAKEPAIKYAWEELPQTCPASVRFMLATAVKESAQAASSPFPYAKFLHGVTKEICGLEFALVFLSINNDAGQIAEQTGLSLNQVEELITNGSANITDAFAVHCPEMYRKWRAQFAGRGLTVESLIEHHSVSGVSRDFQAMVASVVLAAMGIKIPVGIRASNTDAIARTH